MQQTLVFTKGERLSLDEVYDVIGIIPNDAYDQDDISENCGGFNLDNDGGESVLFLKNVTIKIDMEVT